MLRFLLYLILFYLIFVFVKNMLSSPKNEWKKVKNKNNKKTSFNINKDNIEDAKFKEIDK